MRHLKMTKPQCLLYSAAMVLDVEVEHLISIIGHDGMKYPGRWMHPIGIHMQEIQMAALQMGYCFAPVEFLPVSDLYGVEYKIKNNCGLAPMDTYNHYLKYKGIIIGECSNGHYHAVAFEDGSIYNPSSAELAGVKELWLLASIQLAAIPSAKR